MSSHLLPQRYLAAVLGGASNPNRGTVARDIVDAILAARAEKDKPAVYRGQPEQEERLQAVYEKWAKVTGVWSAAASKARRFLVFGLSCHRLRARGLWIGTC
jgi:hypothetical protein